MRCCFASTVRSCCSTYAAPTSARIEIKHISYVPAFRVCVKAMSSEREAAAELQPGDQVEWGAPVPGRGKTSGEVVEIVTEDTSVGKNHFKASEDNPKVRVKSSKTGKEAVHKPSSVRKTEGDEEEEEDE